MLMKTVVALLAGSLLLTATARADTAESALRSANAGLIAASADHTCAIATDGSVRCWGNGGFGELGYDSKTSIGGGTANGYLAMSTLQPVNLGGHTAVQITAVGPSTCALLDDGSVRCWGANGFGELGIDSIKNAGDGVAGDFTMASLTGVYLGQKAVAISGGDYHACAVLADGSVKCWGLGATGELGQASYGNAGDYTTSPSFGMHTLPAVNLGAGNHAVSSSIGGPGNLQRGDSCVVLSDGTARCWGDNEYGQDGHDFTGTMEGGTGSSSIAARGAIPLPQKVLAISTGGYHTCAILADGTVRCWGYNNYGQLGDGTTKNAGDGVAGDTKMADLQPVPLGQKATAISAGLLHTCAILADGTLKCWGYNGDGQIGYRQRGGRADADGHQPRRACGDRARHGRGAHLRPARRRHAALLGPRRLRRARLRLVAERQRRGRRAREDGAARRGADPGDQDDLVGPLGDPRRERERKRGGADRDARQRRSGRRRRERCGRDAAGRADDERPAGAQRPVARRGRERDADHPCHRRCRGLVHGARGADVDHRPGERLDRRCRRCAGHGERGRWRERRRRSGTALTHAYAHADPDRRARPGAPGPGAPLRRRRRSPRSRRACSPSSR